MVYIMKTIGVFLKEKRNQAGLSLRQASRLSGVSHTHIRDIEKGSSVPSFEMVIFTFGGITRFNHSLFLGRKRLTSSINDHAI